MTAEPAGASADPATVFPGAAAAGAAAASRLASAVLAAIDSRVTSTHSAALGRPNSSGSSLRNLDIQ